MTAVFVVTAKLDLVADSDGWLPLPAWLAAELRRCHFVLEPAPAPGPDQRPTLLGLPLPAAPAASAAVLDGRDRLRLPPDWTYGPTIRFTGGGRYFILEG